jgi:hypothetical protein
VVSIASFRMNFRLLLIFLYMCAHGPADTVCLHSYLDALKVCVLQRRFSQHQGTLESCRIDVLDLCTNLLLWVASNCPNRGQKAALEEEAVGGKGCVLGPVRQGGGEGKRQMKPGTAV